MIDWAIVTFNILFVIFSSLLSLSEWSIRDCVFVVYVHNNPTDIAADTLYLRT